jgi:P-type E1-E2 ATPase
VIEVTIPGRGIFQIEYLILDLNGTIAFDGKLIRGVRERVIELSKAVEITVVTADTNKNAEMILRDLPASLSRICETEENVQKQKLLSEKGKMRTVCIGNGSNDAYMLRDSILGICILGREGASFEAMTASDLVVPHINDALDLLLKPNRIKASLRK